MQSWTVDKSTFLFPPEETTLEGNCVPLLKWTRQQYTNNTIQFHSVDSFYHIGAGAIAYCENNDCVQLKTTTTTKEKRTKRKKKKAKNNKILLNSKSGEYQCGLTRNRNITNLTGKTVATNSEENIFERVVGFFSVHLF